MILPETRLAEDAASFTYLVTLLFLPCIIFGVNLSITGGYPKEEYISQNSEQRGTKHSLFLKLEPREEFSLPPHRNRCKCVLMLSTH